MDPTPSPFMTSTTDNDKELGGAQALISSNMSHLRPILVGYAFGPKKMSTMGVVMAEASMAVSTVVTDITLKRVDSAITPTTTMTSTTISSPSPNQSEYSSRKKDGGGYKRIRHEETSSSTSSCSTHLTSSSSSSSGMKRRRVAPVNSSSISYSISSESNMDFDNDGERKYARVETEEDTMEHCSSDVDDSSLTNYNTSNADYDVASIVSADGIGHSSNNVSTNNSSGNSTSGSIYFYTGRTSGGSLLNSSNPEENGLKNIWNIFPSSASPSMCGTSMSDTASVTTTATSMCGTQGGSITSMVPSKKMKLGKYHVPQHFQEMRVSFVPLDLDSPLEEQHGGKIDAILHKMTEDILCLSQLSDTNREGRSTHDNIGTTSITTTTTSTNQTTARNESKDLAIQRVQRLIDYKKNHPSCCLLDHPNNVKAVMSRSDIAYILSECLNGVYTKNGLPVRTPSFHIWRNEAQDTTSSTMDVDCNINGNSDNNHYQTQEVAKRIDNGPFTYPLIIKPLTAAGTVESHKMAVVLGRQGLNKVHCPCLLQEYANHNGILHKVYVLGDRVWVFHRPSLPDLPLHECESSGPEYVEFDSQRPYPKLSDFGFPADELKDEKEISNASPMNKQDNDFTYQVSSEEIRPVADCLRKAFGLELFGFDILVSMNSEHGEREMLVVDVNYFPSYKEVTNFSEILAQHLAQCAFEGRIKSLSSEDIK